MSVTLPKQKSIAKLAEEPARIAVVVWLSPGLSEGLLVSSTLDGSQEEVAVEHTDITPARF